MSNSAYEPQLITTLLQDIFDRFDTLTDTYSVQRVRKTVNESYMVAAGLPDPDLLRSPKERALGVASLAFAMLHVMDVLNAQIRESQPVDAPPIAPLDLQVGIHSGSAIAGIVGHRRIQYDLVGDAVNTAARMCSYSQPGRINVSPTTAEYLVGAYEMTARGERHIKGKG